MATNASPDRANEHPPAEPYRPKGYRFLKFAAGVFEALAVLSVIGGIAAFAFLLKNPPTYNGNEHDLTYVLMLVASVLGAAIGGVANFALSEICRMLLDLVVECHALRGVVSELQIEVRTPRAAPPQSPRPASET